MARASSIKRLPPEIRDEIARLREQAVTIDQILAKLRELGAEVSRSALGRYVKEIDEIGERIRRDREIADVLVRRLGDGPESKQARLNIELMHSLVLRLSMAAEQDGNVQLDPKDVLFLSSALNNLASAQKHDAALVLKLRTEAAKEAAAAVDRVAKTRGLSAETVADLKEQFLGIARRP